MTKKEYMIRVNGKNPDAQPFIIKIKNVKVETVKIQEQMDIIEENKLYDKLEEEWVISNKYIFE